MQSFNPTNLKEEVVLFIRSWLKLLSENNMTDASAILDKSEYLIQKNIEYVDLIDMCFSTYYEDQSHPVFTSPDKMDLSKERISIYDYTDGSGFALDYDLPLDGKWSDFTAQFNFKKMNNSFYLVYLDDIHIL